MLTIIGRSTERKSKMRRPRLHYTEDIKRDTGCTTYEEVKRLHANRSEWRTLTNQSKD